LLIVILGFKRILPPVKIDTINYLYNYGYTLAIHMYNKDIPKKREKQQKIQFYQLNQGVTQNEYNRK